MASTERQCREPTWNAHIGHVLCPPADGCARDNHGPAPNTSGRATPMLSLASEGPANV